MNGAPVGGIVRNVRIATLILFFLISTTGFAFSKSDLSQISDGILSNGEYVNQPLGVRFQIPIGWTPSLGAETSLGLNVLSSKKPTGTCLKELVGYEITSSKHSGFKSKGSFFALDPECFDDARFPKKYNPADIRSFAGKMIHAFSKSDYIAPDGADVGAFQKEDFIFVVLDGAVEVQQPDGKAFQEKMRLVFTSFNGLWIGWGVRAEDEQIDDFGKLVDGVKFWIGPKGTMPN